MKALVTGGTGFVGAHLTRRLLERGHAVRTLDLAPGLASGELAHRGAEMITGSVSDAAAVDRATAGCDVVFHLASPFGDVTLPDSVYWDVEVVGTRTVMEAAQRHGVRRVVHCSTQGVHGIVTTDVGDEDSPIAPRDYYCYSKAEAENVAREFMARGLDVTVLRPTSIYGPGDIRGWRSLYRMVNGGRFLMIGSGRTRNHPVYVDNFVDALELAAEVPAARGRTYIIGDDTSVTLTELVLAVGRAVGRDVQIVRFPSYRLAWLGAALVEAVCKPLGVKPPVFRRRMSWFRTNRAWSIERARHELGYSPRVDLATGLARTALWYREHGYLERAHRPAPAPGGLMEARGA
jgi:nucleoside-diphosphate-sugar epimerase